jgi:phage terminase small subunit
MNKRKNTITERMRQFCQLYVETGNGTQSYQEVYKMPKASYNTIAGKASLLLKDERIKEFINKLQEEHKERHAVTIDGLIAELEDARILAFKKENANAAIQATMGKAKICGLDKKVIEMTGKDLAPVINMTINKKNK